MSAKSKFFHELIAGDFEKAKAIFYDNDLPATVTESRLAGGVSALAIAIKMQHHEFAADLIARGANVNARAEGVPVLHFATDAKGVEMLVEAGAKIDAVQTRDTPSMSKGSTALNKAAFFSNREVVQALIKAGARIDVPDREGFRAVDFAASRDEPILNDLITAGADVDGHPGKNIRALIAEYFPNYRYPHERKAIEGLEVLAAEGAAAASAADLAAAEAKKAAKEKEEQEAKQEAEEAVVMQLPAQEQANSVEAGSKTQDRQTIDAEVLSRVAAKWLGKSVPAENEIEPRGESVISGGTIPPQEDILAKAASELKKSIPDMLESRYLRVGDKFHHAAKPELQAFEDKGLKLETRSNSMKIATDMVAIANHRGWTDLRVRGTEEFRRTVWLEGVARGLDVQGYKPTELDLVLLEKRRAELPGNVIEAGRETIKTQEQQAPSPTSTQSKEAQLRAAGAVETAAAIAAAAATGVVPGADKQPETVALKKAGLAGELLEHGPARYNFDKEEKNSYYVKFRDGEGKEQIQWGVDLGRAMKDSGAKIGDQITLTKEGKKAVEVSANVRDDAGKVVGSEMIVAERNQWTVKAEALREKPPAEAVKEHPDLIGAVGAMHAAQKAAKVMYPNATPEALAKFSETFRETVANIVQDRQTAPVAFIKEQVPVAAKTKSTSAAKVMDAGKEAEHDVG